MINNEALSGISWHLECMVLAAQEIDNFRPPADGFQMRMHYSLYLTNLMSAIDIVHEIHGEPFRLELVGSLTTPSLTGDQVLGYIRELRNGVVHRGIDLTTSGIVVDGVTCALAPTTVTNRFGTLSYTAPSFLLRDIFIHCEIGIKLIIERFLESTFDELTKVTSEEMLNDFLNEIEAAPYMPDWAKEIARNHIKPEMLMQAKAQQTEKLRELLKPRAGQCIA